jgi:transcriptional regulator with XRE-family HTH domain
MVDVKEIVARAHRRRELPPPQARQAIRQAAGISQEELASALGVSRQTVANWERGTRFPSSDHLVPYGRVLQRLADEMA